MSLEQSTRDNVEALRTRAHLDERIARVLERVGLLLGLRSGAYLAGCRQHPTVEEQCGCARYCAPKAAR
jgi:hypothetical protein